MRKKLGEKELQHRQLRVEMENVKGELRHHHQYQESLLRGKATLERWLQELTQAEAQKRVQLEEALVLALQAASEKHFELEEAVA